MRLSGRAGGWEECLKLDPKKPRSPGDFAGANWTWEDAEKFLQLMHFGNGKGLTDLDGP